MVDLVLGCRGEADEQAVEPFEDGAVFLIDRAVRLVNDDQIEIAGPEATFRGVVHRIDEVHHRGIGGDIDAAVAGLLRHEIDGGDGR